MRRGTPKWNLRTILIVWLLVLYAASGARQHESIQGTKGAHTGIRSIRGSHNTNEQWIDEEWMVFLRKQQDRIEKLRDKQIRSNCGKGRIRCGRSRKRAILKQPSRYV